MLNIMIREQDENSEEEGFYKPAMNVHDIKVETPLPVSPPLDFSEAANNLITHQRPQDFLPRVLAVAPAINCRLVDLELVVKRQGEGQQLFAIRKERGKKSKFASLRQKYREGSGYRMAYSKVGDSQQFNSYLFPLRHTTDYNPNNYQTPQQTINPLASDNSLFDSHFQSGNLLYAFEPTERPQTIPEYDLILQNDTNTKGYNQWFYFSYRNEHRTKARFNIVNLVKKNSLIQEGVRPVGFSLKQSHKGWQSIGEQIQYGKSFVAREISGDPPTYKNYYTLAFTINFQAEDDTVFVALNYPYTYSRMVKFMGSLPQLYPQLNIQKHILCHSISNNPVPYLRITRPQHTPTRTILAIARQHPGETVGSFVLQGFLQKVLENPILLNHHQLVIVPMVNPDGVIYGNFRTNLSGFDLNRQWLEPSKSSHPQIFYLKRMIQSLNNLSFVIDFHGHSKKYDSFIFSCSGDQMWQYRVFPYTCSKHCRYFSLKDCTFSLTADKQRTARVQLFRMINKPHVYTLETSFFGYSNSNGKRQRYEIKDLHQIGIGIGESLQKYLYQRQQTALYEKEVKEKEYLFEQWSAMNRADVDSESNPSEDELTAVERKLKGVDRERKGKKKGKKKGAGSNGGQGDFHLNSNYTSRQKKAGQAKILFNTSERIKVNRGDLAPPIHKKRSQSVKAAKFKRDAQQLSKCNQEKIPMISTTGIVRPPRSLQKIDPVGVKVEVSSPRKEQQKLVVQDSLTAARKVDRILPVADRGGKKTRSEGKDSKLRTMSNLFNTTNYYSQIQDKLQRRESRRQAQDSNQSIEVRTIRQETEYTGAMDVIRKLISNKQEGKPQQSSQLDIGARLKYKERNSAARDNKVILSIRQSEPPLYSRNTEEQITHRTQALRNCQQKMTSLDWQQQLRNRMTEAGFGLGRGKERQQAFRL